MIRRVVEAIIFIAPYVMNRYQNAMEQSGITDDGKPVLSGVGVLSFTNGVPLEVILSAFKSKGLVVDWVDYIATALKDGHNPKTVRARIASAVGDVYGPTYVKEMLPKVDMVISALGKN